MPPTAATRRCGAPPIRPAPLQFFLELPKILNDPNLTVGPWIFLSNALAAFGARAVHAGACRWPCGASRVPLTPLAGARCCDRSSAAGSQPSEQGATLGACLQPSTPRPHPSRPGATTGLNMAVFLLIGKTSALTMNIAGVVKDWLLILLSFLMYK